MEAWAQAQERLRHGMASWYAGFLLEAEKVRCVGAHRSRPGRRLSVRGQRVIGVTISPKTSHLITLEEGEPRVRVLMIQHFAANHARGFPFAAVPVIPMFEATY